MQLVQFTNLMKKNNGYIRDVITARWHWRRPVARCLPDLTFLQGMQKVVFYERLLSGYMVYLQICFLTYTQEREDLVSDMFGPNFVLVGAKCI